jgi:hypothetical protein
MATPPRKASKGDILGLHNCIECDRMLSLRYKEQRGERSWLYECEANPSYKAHEVYVYECWNCDKMFSSQQSNYDRSSQSRFCPNCGKSLGDRQKSH